MLWRNTNSVIWFILFAVWILTSCVIKNGFLQPEIVKNVIVKIEGRQRVDGQVTDIGGAGIIFGRVNDRLYIATANHVVRQGMQGARELRVKFAFLPEAVEAKLCQQYDQTLDLAVLRVNLHDDATLAEQLNDWLSLEQINCEIDLQSGSTREQEVYPIGHPVGIDFFIPSTPANIYEIVGETIRFEYRADPGYSGGGLFNTNGELIGMIRSTSGPISEAISFKSICETLKSTSWNFPVNLKPASPPVTSTPTPTPTPTPTSTPTPTPPPPPITPTPTPKCPYNEKFCIIRIVLIDAQGQSIAPVQGVYTVNVDEPVTINVRFANPDNHNIDVTWTAAPANHGEVSLFSETTTTDTVENVYIAEESGPAVVTIHLLNMNTNTRLEQPISINVVR